MLVVNLEGPNGSYPLHEASRAGSPRLASLLLRWGADVDSEDSRGR
ncbi:unnamed protein product [Sphacelaria rigidula]